MIKTERGFTLLLSVLISSVLLALGYEMYNLAFKEVALSSAGRESQFAFYAADSGIECSLYGDSKLDIFATTSVATEIMCGTVSSPLTRFPLGYVSLGTPYITTFSFSLGPELNAQCATIRVTRDDPKRTTIESFGYNTCVLTNPLRLERAIRVTY